LVGLYTFVQTDLRDDATFVQTDLRDDATTLEKLSRVKMKPVTFEMGESLARELKAVKYVECSALTQKGLKDVFDQALIAALEPTMVRNT